MLEIIFLALGMLTALFLMVLIRGFLSLRLYREWKNAVHTRNSQPGEAVMSGMWKSDEDSN
jgi:hypothetical protein